MQYGLGIDLGTTHTAAAVRVDGRVEVVRLGGRRAEIPSLVFVKPDGGLLIGEAAERRGAAEPARLAREFKRRMGDPVPILVGGTPFSAHALTAKLLRHVLDTVAQLQDGPPAAITVTHPANWGPYKREQLDQAIKLADAGPVQLRSEPEAAALQHATARRIADGETVAVYDLGGGTFDVAVLRRDGDGFVVLGEPEGVEQLGGIDFDEAVFGHVLEVLGDKAQLDPGDPEAVAALARLRRDCVEAKEALSFDTETMIPIALPGLHTRVRLNRSELESMIAPSLTDTISATQRALRSAGVAPAQVSAFLLAGGSSRIPLVAQLLSTEFQRPVVADPHPEHSIAMGAAVATAVVVGGGSPFAAAVPPPRPAEPSDGYSAAGVSGAGLSATVPAPANAGGAPAGSAPYGGGTPASSGPPYGGDPAGGPPYGGGTPANGNPPYGSSP
ncbi:Hsp70 family protein, partial [Actinoplanes sp. NPDC026619]|uniref:Hsp70 family protein n=1 Tax=Actinoplanes sp. NPDC026619 TaxID=3155798 RepID=UPI0033CC35A6